MNEAADNAMKWARQAEILSENATAPNIAAMAEMVKAQGMASMWAFTALAEVFSSETFRRKLNR